MQRNHRKGREALKRNASRLNLSSHQLQPKSRTPGCIPLESAGQKKQDQPRNPLRLPCAERPTHQSIQIMIVWMHFAGTSVLATVEHALGDSCGQIMQRHPLLSSRRRRLHNARTLTSRNHGSVFALQHVRGGGRVLQHARGIRGLQHARGGCALQHARRL